MNKFFIFIVGIICGIFISVITFSIINSIHESLIKDSAQPVITNQVESPEDQDSKPNVQTDEPDNSPNEGSSNYVRYWQSNGIKFKDVGENGIEKTFVWNVKLKEWVDTGCVGYFDE